MVNIKESNDNMNDGSDESDEAINEMREVDFNNSTEYAIREKKCKLCKCKI